MKTVTINNPRGQDQDRLYIADYIQRAISSTELEAPDLSRANGSGDSLLSLYQAHRSNGAAGAKDAWKVVRTLRPDVAQLFLNPYPLLMHADDLKSLSSPIYLQDYYPLYQYGFNVLVGPSGGGKSFVALDASGRIACESPVVYIAGEGLNGYAARWEAWKHHYKVKSAELYFYTQALQVLEEEDLTNFISLISQHEPSLVVIDTLARSAVGVDENSAKEMGQFVGACDRIRVSLNCSVLVVHHTGKNGVMRGSSALYGAADSIMSLIKNDDRIIVYNHEDHGGKNKHAPARDPMFFSLLPVEAGGYSGAVLVEAERIIVSTEKISSVKKQILEALDGYDAGLSAAAIISATGIKQSSAYYNLQALVKSGHLDYDDERYTLTEKGQSVLEF